MDYHVGKAISTLQNGWDNTPLFSHCHLCGRQPFMEDALGLSTAEFRTHFGISASRTGGASELSCALCILTERVVQHRQTCKACDSSMVFCGRGTLWKIKWIDNELRKCPHVHADEAKLTAARHVGQNPPAMKSSVSAAAVRPYLASDRPSL